MVQAIDICKEYHLPDSNVVAALKNLNLRVKAGEFVAIMGPSGSGKSTLMNILGCLDRPSRGKYLLNGEDTSRFNEGKLATFRRDTVGFIFQSFFLLPGLTAQENVELPLFYSNEPKNRRRVVAQALLEQFGLLQRAKHFPSQLSGGQRQRIAIARALVNDPMLILADEPTGNLDEQSGKIIMEAFKQLNRHGRTIILITHDAGVAAYANRIIRIEDGRALK
ncbi:ABC transporter ATP-binding protein [Clostridia bacterium OttesenSCG-928-F22]|nr:ABC transporter ATP-binding protein [Clostridia bacterium OttesenSCG-928-F22]